MFKLDLEKAQEPEIKLPTSIGSSEKQERSRNTSISAFSFIDYAKAFDCVDHNKLWKILQEMKILQADHLTCLLRNLYAGQKATVKTRYGTKEWFQIGKGVHQGCILSLCLFNLYAECIMQNAGLDEAKVDVLLEFSCFFYDPTDVGNLISGSSTFSKPDLYTWKFTVHIMLKPASENFEHYFTSM